MRVLPIHKPNRLHLNWWFRLVMLQWSSWKLLVCTYQISPSSSFSTVANENKASALISLHTYAAQDPGLSPPTSSSSAFPLHWPQLPWCQHVPRSLLSGQVSSRVPAPLIPLSVPNPGHSWGAAHVGPCPTGARPNQGCPIRSDNRTFFHLLKTGHRADVFLPWFSP